MKFSGWLFLFLFACSSCASGPKERKPFMIVSKAQTPERLFGGLTLSGDVSAFNYSGENIGTNYKSFNGTGLSPAAVVSYHFGPYGLNLFYRYRYSWLRHEVTNDKNERIFAEKMRAETSEAEIMLARGLYRVKGVGLYGVFVSYAPYLDLRLHHLSSSPGWKRHYYGNAVSVAPYWGSYHFPLLAWIKYKKSNYNKGFSSQELSLGIDIWVGLF